MVTFILLVLYLLLRREDTNPESVECEKNYTVNKCAQKTNIRVLAEACERWKVCMADRTTVARVTMRDIGVIMEEFLSNLSNVSAVVLITILSSIKTYF